MEQLKSPQERVDKYSTWLAHYQLLLLPGAAGDAANRTIEVRVVVVDDYGGDGLIRLQNPFIHPHCFQPKTDPGAVRDGWRRFAHKPAPSGAAHAAGAS